MASSLVEAATKNDRGLLERALTTELGHVSQDDVDKALRNACARGHVDIAARLLAEEADPSIPDYNGDTALIVATEYDKYRVVKLLLSMTDIDIDQTNDRGRTALHAAVSNSCELMVRVLLRNHARTDIKDSQHETPLQLAARIGATDILRYLLVDGADVHMVNGEKDTALHCAARSGQVEIIEWLLRFGARVDDKNMWMNTPLVLAVMYGHAECASVLIEAGSDVHFHDRDYCSILHHAVKSDLQGVVFQLLLMDVCPDVEDTNGNVPLFCAVLKNNLDVTWMLIQANCNVNCTGQRPVGHMRMWCSTISVALQSGNLLICKLLVAAGCDTSPIRSWAQAENRLHSPNETDDSAFTSWVQEVLNTPKSLQGICRIAIRNTAGYKFQKKVLKLPIPAQVQRYLSFSGPNMFS